VILNDEPLEIPVDPLVVDRSNPPVRTLQDAISLLPGVAQEAEGPVRDAVLQMIRKTANALWARAGRVLSALVSPRFAVGTWLDDWGNLLKRRRRPLETDGEYRARLMSTMDMLTPAAIRRTLDAIYAGEPFRRPVMMEPATDWIFCQDADTDSAWLAYVQGQDARLWADYPDNPNPHCGVMACYADNPAEFWVICPGDALLDETAAFAVHEATVDEDEDDPVWVDHVSDETPLWVDLDLRFADPVENLIDKVLSEIEARRAAGVRWVLWIDPLLENAR
jgi:hypothetical protein